MSESHKQIKLTENLPQDLVDHIISLFLPIKSLLRNRALSTDFKDTKIRSRDLDFSRIFSVRHTQLEAVSIIDKVFNQHEGSEIYRFVLFLNHTGVENKIHSWVKTCICKNIREFELDFSKSRRVVEIQVDFSAIETLTVLKLRWCKFKIQDNSPKGLKLLRTLELMKNEVTKEMIDAIFSNCIHLETLELIKCRMIGILSINAQNHKKFKSLVVYSMTNLLDIVLDAPTLECYKYEGFVRMVNFSRVNALKEAKLHYNRSYNWRYYNSSDMVIANMGAYTGVHVLTTTHIFLEAFTYKYTDGEMAKPTFVFGNLKEFQICFKGPTICNLYDIAEFLKQCRNLERVLIDINGFTFEPDSYWNLHQKDYTQNHNYKLNSIRKVEINGYKGHWHELEIVEFFVWNAKSLGEFILRTPKNRKIKLSEHDRARINFIKSMYPRRDLSIKLVQG